MSPLEGVADDARRFPFSSLVPEQVRDDNSLVSNVVPYGLHSTFTLRSALIFEAVKLEFAKTAWARPMANFKKGFTHFFLRISKSSAPWKFRTSGIPKSFAAPSAM